VNVLRSALAAVATALILAGCAMVGPDYTAVAPDAPDSWHTEMADGLVAAPPAPETMARWWEVFSDPELEALEKRAVSGNLGLKEARARVREARALRGISRARLFPTLDAGAAVSRQRSSENSDTGRGGAGGESDLYNAGFDAGWELDVFGGLRRTVEAAQANLEASQESLHDVLVSLMAEVALNYLDVRTFQARLVAVRKNVAAQQKTYDLNHSRYQAGLINELAVQESLRILESSRAAIPGLETGLEAAKNRLAVLLGEKPGALHPELATQRPIPVPPVTISVGVPAAALRRRPDIRRAERELAARTARIGAATADLYPKFRLFGSIGLESIDSGKWLEWASRTWHIGPSVSWNVFDGGAIRQNIKVQGARQEQALIRYESAVLNALEEVENALVAYVKEQRRRASLIKAETAARQADLLARDQFNTGLVPFNNVLDAQRALVLLEDKRAQSEGAVTANLVRLYKALGGGWEPLAGGGKSHRPPSGGRVK
jgi:NodT family efflux transporter outer membrane factor (OMF) lipoprotein